MGGVGDAGGRARMAAYLASLPAGLASFPECQIKASFYRAVLESLPRPPSGLPPELAELVAAPPPISSWIPEVHHHALVEAIAEELYPSADAYLEVAYAGQRRLFTGRIYAPLIQLFSPERLLRQAARRWTNFHRGTTLTIASEEARAAVAVVQHPFGLFSPVGQRSVALGFQAALESSAGRECRVVVGERRRGATVFRATWA